MPGSLNKVDYFSSNLNLSSYSPILASLNSLSNYVIVVPFTLHLDVSSNALLKFFLSLEEIVS